MKAERCRHCAVSWRRSLLALALALTRLRQHRAVGEAVRAPGARRSDHVVRSESRVSTAYIDHVFEAREGARGALGSAGGGCGCN